MKTAVITVEAAATGLAKRVEDPQRRCSGCRRPVLRSKTVVRKRRGIESLGVADGGLEFIEVPVFVNSDDKGVIGAVSRMAV